MKLVLFRPEKLNPPLRGEQYYDRLRLNPGTNHRSEDEVKKLLAHPDYAQHSEWGAIEVIEEKPTVPKKTTVESGLDKLSEEDAQKVIEATFDIPMLEGYLAKEQRKAIVNLLNRRITELKKGNA
ncbi:MAG: hypothetical protein KME13_21630 [Myxacorys californica WJT36-NPBG1]|nr:hypothetical protein [Myxacorys californica WJT36-NPBG1]